VSGSKDGLEISQDLPFQRREWRAQRMIWILLSILLVAAVAGLVGPGPLSLTSTGSAGLQVRYLRFGRWQAPQSLVVSASQAGSGPLRLSINRSYLDSMSVQQITPQPANVKLSGQAFIYTFATGTGASNSITFDLQPTSMGLVHGTIALLAAPGNGSDVNFRQLIYP
jgi:hypothetical protein